MNLIEAMKTGEEFREAGKSVIWKYRQNTLSRKPSGGYWFEDGNIFLESLYDKEFELVEKKPEKLGKTYVCIKDFKVIKPVEKQYLMGDCVITNKANAKFWQPVKIDSEGSVWSVEGE